MTRTANQRTTMTNADLSYWQFGYDLLGRVTNGLGSRSDGSEVLGQTFNYAFDDVGNRKSAGTGSQGAQRTQVYSPNLLNQYTNRTVPGFIEVNGSADVSATVTVNGAGTFRHCEYYRQEVAVNNSGAALLQWLTNRAVVATGTTVVTRVSNVAQTPEVSSYDADGNLTQDGLWNYTWDGENRLSRIETRTNAITDSAFWQRIDCTYDYMSRRIRKQVSGWTGTGWTIISSKKFFYDGWNLIGQVDELTGIRLSFVWGTDLSGTSQGAGGVGGLLALIVHNGALTGTYFYGYDGNGNVTLLTSGADGSEAARYEYGVFGELLRSSGQLAKLNPLTFSCKCLDDETALSYYGYRYLRTGAGRWLSRDPLGEWDGANLQEFSLNNPEVFVDRDGLQLFLTTPLDAVVRVGGEFGTDVTKPVFDNFAVPRQFTGPLNNQPALRPVGPNLLPPVPQGPPQTDQQAQKNPTERQTDETPIDPAGHRGRIQAQGCKVEKSVPWSQPTPPTVLQGLYFVDRLEQLLTPAERRDRENELDLARAYIERAGRAGGVQALINKSFINYNLKRKGVRIDIDVLKGRAFVPVPPRLPRPVPYA